MSDVSPRSCPDPSILAAFVEGSLDDRLRAEVEPHVANCPECPVVIAETVRFLRSAEEPDSDSDAAPRRRWRLATAAAMAALCIPAAVWIGGKRDPLRRVKQLAAESATRPVEGRLAEFEFAPYPGSRSQPAERTDRRLQTEAKRLEAAGTDVTSLHARGVAQLLTGDAVPAIQLLTAATGAEPEKAAVWNDLAAAHLALAAVRNDESHVASALAASNRAIELSPTLASAHFNRALALQHLGRRAEAAHAFRRSMEAEPRSPWNDEIAKRISLLEE